MDAFPICTYEDKQRKEENGRRIMTLIIYSQIRLFFFVTLLEAVILMGHKQTQRFKSVFNFGN